MIVGRGFLEGCLWGRYIKFFDGISDKRVDVAGAALARSAVLKR